MFRKIKRWLKWLTGGRPNISYPGYCCGLCGTWIDFSFEIPAYLSYGGWWDTIGICPACRGNDASESLDKNGEEDNA